VGLFFSPVTTWGTVLLQYDKNQPETGIHHLELLDRVSAWRKWNIKDVMTGKG
jgi:hypothetical protein